MAAALHFDEVLDSVREPGSVNLSPDLIANRLQLPLQDLAAMARVHRNTVRLHPESPRMQLFLRDVMRVLSAASQMQPDTERAWFLIKNAPIPEFGHRTLLTVIAEGRTDAAVTYLDSVSSGFVG